MHTSHLWQRRVRGNILRFSNVGCSVLQFCHQCTSISTIFGDDAYTSAFTLKNGCLNTVPPNDIGMFVRKTVERFGKRLYGQVSQFS